MKTYQVGTSGTDAQKLRKEINDQLRQMSIDIANLQGNNTIPVALNNNLNMKSNTITGAAAAVNATDVPNLSQVNSLIATQIEIVRNQYTIPWQLCGKFSLVGTPTTTSGTYYALGSINLISTPTVDVSLYLIASIFGWNAMTNQPIILKVSGHTSGHNYAILHGRTDGVSASGCSGVAVAPAAANTDASLDLNLYQQSGAGQQLNVGTVWIYSQVGQ